MLSELGTLKPPKPATYHSANAEPGKPTRSSANMTRPMPVVIETNSSLEKEDIIEVSCKYAARTIVWKP